MKMKLTILLLASVFFVSCGMPILFAPSSPTDYTFTSLPADTDINNKYINVKGKLSMHLVNPGINYDLLGDSVTKGPSLMFFYAFGGSEASGNQFVNSSSSFVGKFKQEFMNNGYEGKVVSNPAKLVSTDSDGKEVFLYGVNTKPATNFNANDQYVLYAKETGNNASLNNFKLTKTNLDTPQDGYTLDLTWEPITSFESNASTGNKLYAFNGKPFLSRTSLIRISDTGEYDFVKDGDLSNGIQIHLFAAFFISGPFSNYFWSDLVHLGSIPINLQ